MATIKMVRNLIGRLTVTLALLLAAYSAHADSSSNPVGVVELFTSQGCSSCPPADAVFAELAARKNVVALAYHVDYWDYLGWRDTFGGSDNTARQYAYMKAFRAKSVYTPQAVINGRKHVNGAKKDKISKALSDLDRVGAGLKVKIKARHSGNSLTIEADAAAGIPGEAHVVLVYFDPPSPVVIDGGENGGKTITYWNPVTGIQTAGMWHGKSVTFELPMQEIMKRGSGGCAVLLQQVKSDGGPGPILGATVIHQPASN